MVGVAGKSFRAAARSWEWARPAASAAVSTVGVFPTRLSCPLERKFAKVFLHLLFLKFLQTNILNRPRGQIWGQRVLSLRTHASLVAMEDGHVNRLIRQEPEFYEKS